MIWLGDLRARCSAQPISSRPRFFGWPFSSLIDSAALTAASELMSPAPCSNEGAFKSVAVLMRISLTVAGEGSLPPCVLR